MSHINNLWYAFPLILSISLVYSATRHESMPEIFRHAIRVGVWIVGFMGAVLAVLTLLSRFV